MCEKCQPGVHTERLVDEATSIARNVNKSKANIEGKRIWDEVKPSLTCTLCQRNPDTWKPPTPSKAWTFSYRWYERQYGNRSIILCPTCGSSNFFAYSPASGWTLTEARFKETLSLEDCNWQRDKHDLVGMKVDQLLSAHPPPQDVTTAQLKTELKRRKIRSRFDEDVCENSVANHYLQLSPSKNPANSHKSPGVRIATHAVRQFNNNITTWNEKKDNNTRKPLTETNGNMK